MRNLQVPHPIRELTISLSMADRISTHPSYKDIEDLNDNIDKFYIICKYRTTSLTGDKIYVIFECTHNI